MNISSLGYVGIETTDLERWRLFATEILGMMPAPGRSDDGKLYFKIDAYPYRFCIFSGERDGFAYAGWELPGRTEFEAAKQQLRDSGINFDEPDRTLAEERGVSDIICLKDPAGSQVEIVWGLGIDYARMISPVGVSGFVTGLNGDMGLGHIVIPTANFQETVEFYTDVLGFGITDYMDVGPAPDKDTPAPGLYFLHAACARHHSLAIVDMAEPPESGLVHMMIEVENIDEVGRCMDRCAEKDIGYVSLGRHCNDLMLSIYIHSPGNFAFEYGCDGLQFHDWDSYTPTVSKTPSHWGHKWG